MSEQTVAADAERETLGQEDTFRALADAYGFVHGQEELRSVASLTFGQIIQTRIDEIRGPHPQDLPPLLDEIRQVKEQFDVAIARLEAREEETSG